MRILSYKSAIVKLQFDGPPRKIRRFRDFDGALRAARDLRACRLAVRRERLLGSRQQLSPDRRRQVAWSNTECLGATNRVARVAIDLLHGDDL